MSIFNPEDRMESEWPKCTGKLIEVPYMISDYCLDDQHKHCKTKDCECKCHE